MKKRFLIVFVALTAALSSCTRIDAGHEGIKVNLVGSDRGIDNVNLVTGWVWYNPFSTSVFEYPTFVQTVDYPPFTINAKDGSEFTVDPTVSMKVLDGKTPVIFKKYRTGLDDVINGVLFNYVKDAFRIQMNNFSTNDIVSKRDSLEKNIEKSLRETLLKEGFELEQLTSGLKYPKTIVDAVNAKNKAVQDAMRVENELKIQEAQAKKVIVAAEAERQANELKQKALTPAILQQLWIEKWDGKLPTYSIGNNTPVMLNLK